MTASLPDPRDPATHVLSKDGTVIAYTEIGRGPSVVLVDGALCSRAMGPMTKIARALADDFTVYTYDRRGRGESGDSPVYAVAREVEDLEALVERAGGSAFVLGISSGAVLALTAAAAGVKIVRLALYEAPLVIDAIRAPIVGEWAAIDAAIAQGRRGDAVRTFLASVGVPALVVAVMRLLPVWRKIVSVAHTLPRDGGLVRDLQTGAPIPAHLWSGVTIPALALDGSKSPAWMQSAMRALARALPECEHRTLPGQTHDVAATAIAPVLKAFFGSARG